MEKKRILFVLALVFVLVLGGAYTLYGRLSQGLEHNQLKVESPQSQAAGSSSQGAESGQTADSAQAAEPEKVLAPDFTVYDAEGNPVQLYDYIGKPLVVNFWASWCGPCQMEMPHFEDKYQELGDEVQFLMINMTDGGRETVDSASAFIAEKGYTFPVLYDTDSNAALTYGAYSLPTTYFIDADGYAVAQAAGAIDADTLQQGIDLIAPKTES